MERCQLVSTKGVHGKSSISCHQWRASSCTQAALKRRRALQVVGTWYLRNNCMQRQVPVYRQAAHQTPPRRVPSKPLHHTNPLPRFSRALQGGSSWKRHHHRRSNDSTPSPLHLSTQVDCITMSLNIPQAPNSGLFKQGYNKYAAPLPTFASAATPMPRHYCKTSLLQRAPLLTLLPSATATTPKMVLFTATSMPAAPLPRLFRPRWAPTAAARSSSTTCKR